MRVILRALKSVKIWRITTAIALRLWQTVATDCKTMCRPVLIGATLICRVSC